MEAAPQKNIESLRAEYYVAQLAMRSIDFTIAQLQQERSRWTATCNAIVYQAFELGETI